MPIPLGIFAVAGAGGGGFGYEQIATQLVSSSSATVTFSGISSIYKHLQIRFTCKTSSASLPIDLNMWFNGDTGANYTYHQLFGEGSNMFSSSVHPANAIALQNASISSQDNRFGAGIIDIPDYVNTNKFKTIKSLHGVVGQNTASNAQITLGSGFWRNTAAITSISFNSTGGASRTIESGSRFSIYGIR